MNRKGFTLIELLAVIIILGILMIIAIPSVTRYISDSRKSAYIDTAKEIVSGTRNIVNDGKLEMYDTNTTYYIPTGYIKTENASKSPYGDFVEAYVGIIYDGKGYKYFWISADETGQGVKDITLLDSLEEDDIESDLNPSNIRTTVETTGIGHRTDIKIYNVNNKEWDQYSVLDMTENALENGEKKADIVYPSGKNKSSVIVGDKVTIGDQGFYVVKRDGSDLILLAEYNLKVGYIITNGSRSGEYSSNDEGYGMQSSEAKGVISDNNKNFKGGLTFTNKNLWSESTFSFPVDLYVEENNIKQYVDNYANKLGRVVKESRILKLSEAVELGCNASTRKCTGRPFLYSSTYWLSTSNSNYSIWSINNYGSNGYLIGSYYLSAHAGVRPVIVI